VEAYEVTGKKVCELTVIFPFSNLTTFSAAAPHVPLHSHFGGFWGFSGWSLQLVETSTPGEDGMAARAQQVQCKQRQSQGLLTLGSGRSHTASKSIQNIYIAFF